MGWDSGFRGAFWAVAARGASEKRLRNAALETGLKKNVKKGCSISGVWYLYSVFVKPVLCIIVNRMAGKVKK
jgi:hypothetical protein